MRRPLAYLLLGIFLFTNTELHELVKMGAFIGHYLEHRQEKPGLSLLQYVQIHYQKSVVYDEDYSRDMQLPFKTADCVSFSIPCTVPVKIEPELCLPMPEPGATLQVRSWAFHPTFLLFDIWQPPKSC